VRALIGAKIKEYIRILRIARKPSKEELEQIVKICGVGVIAIGLMGFFIQILWQTFWR
jgi:protein transport protein SEC61 subunit gamma-like protein